jgi:hypothetical protein
MSLINKTASSSRQTILAKPRSRWERSTTPILRLFSDEEGLESSPVVFDIDDSEVENDDSALFESNGSLSSLQYAFPAPPTSESTKRLYQARSLNNMSTRYHEQHQTRAHPPPQTQIQQQTSPLRERRHKQPLSIKAPLPPSRLIVRRTRSSSSMIYSPPPCPPPTTPLPDIPSSSGSNTSRCISGQRSYISDEATRSSFDADSSGEWIPKTDRSDSPTLSCASSSSTSTTPSSSSRNSSQLQRRCDRKPLSSTPPTSDNDPALHIRNSVAWSEALSRKLGLAFALHLSSTATTSDDSSHAPSFEDSLPSANEVHVYGFAL